MAKGVQNKSAKKKPTGNTNSEYLRIRLSPKMRKMLEAIATEEKRSLPNMIIRIFEEYIEMKFHLIFLVGIDKGHIKIPFLR